MHTIRVLVCDDSASFSLLVTQWIAESSDLEVAGTARSGSEMLTMLRTITPDVIVLDHLLGDMDSEELTPLIRSQHADAGIVLVSGMPLAALAVIAVRSGVPAFSSKATKPDRLCHAIRQAAAQATHKHGNTRVARASGRGV